MKTLTTLLLTLGLCALSLPAFAGPSCDATGEGELNVMDIVAIVSAVLGTSEDEVNCAGPGCDECADITSNDAEVAAAAAAAVDITTDNQAVCEAAGGTWGSPTTFTVTEGASYGTWTDCDGYGWADGNSGINGLPFETCEAACENTAECTLFMHDGWECCLSSLPATNFTSSGNWTLYVKTAGGDGVCNAADITSNDAEVAADATSGMFTQAELDAAVAAVEITSDNDVAIADAMPACDWDVERWNGAGDGTCECSVGSDCNDVCGGDAVEDECGVCNGDGESCASTCYSTDFLDYYYDDICFESVECCHGVGGILAFWDEFVCDLGSWSFSFMDGNQLAMCQ